MSDSAGRITVIVQNIVLASFRSPKLQCYVTLAIGGPTVGMNDNCCALRLSTWSYLYSLIG